MTKRQRWQTADTDELFRAILKLKNAGDARRFFRDLLTEAELLEFGNRWKVARMLAERVPYVKIERATGMSTRTIARIQRWLKRGKGGYRLMLKRTNL